MFPFCSKVSEIELKKIPLVNKNDTLEYAHKEMEKYGLDRCLVIDTNREAIGILTKKDIMKKLAMTRTLKVDIGRMHVSSFMTPYPHTISNENSIVDAAKMMTKYKIGSLPTVNKDNQVVGLITRREIASIARYMTNIKAKDLSICPPVILSENDKITNARQLFLQYDVLMLPIHKDDRVIGVITINEITDTLLKLQYLVNDRHRGKRLGMIRVSEVMKQDIPVVSSEEMLDSVISKILEKRTNGAIVMENEKMIGMITLIEIVEYISKLDCPS